MAHNDNRENRRGTVILKVRLGEKKREEMK